MRVLAEMGRGRSARQNFRLHRESASDLIYARAGAMGPPEDECRGVSILFSSKLNSIHKPDNTVLYPGVRETLDALSECRWRLTTSPWAPAGDSARAGPVEISIIYGGNSF